MKEAKEGGMSHWCEAEKDDGECGLKFHTCDLVGGHESEHRCRCGFTWPKEAPRTHGNLNWLRDEE